jgi:transcriptional regulator with XRE-family HTH domain
MPVPTPFGRRLKGVRETRGLSQAELGEKAGVPALMISHFETGARPSASAATLVKLANALDTSIDFLLARTDDPVATGRVGALLRSLGTSASQETMDTVLTIAEAMAQKDRARVVSDKSSSPKPTGTPPTGASGRIADD